MIVLELFVSIETTPSIAPHISILLNISPDHLERHGGMRGYVASKETIIKKTRENGVAIVGIGDNFTKNIAKSARNRGILVLDANPAIAAKSLQESIVLAGNHNAENVAAVSQALNFIGGWQVLLKHSGVIEAAAQVRNRKRCENKIYQ